MAHLYGKLLTACSTIKHDGKMVEEDEDMSPISVKRMTVFFGIQYINAILHWTKRRQPSGKLSHSSASQKFRDSPDKRCELFRTNNRQVTFLLFPILQHRSGKYNLCFLSGWRQIIITDGLHNGFSSTE